MYWWALTAVFANLLFIGGMWRTQNWESRSGRIPQRVPHDSKNPTGSFLYLQDFWTSTLGDLLGLSLVDYGVVVLLQDLWPLPFLGIEACAAVGFMGTWVFLWKCLTPRHKPDAGYPAAGKMSATGTVHLLYYWIQVTISCIGLWIIGLMLLGQTPWTLPAFLGLGGATFFFATFLWDVRTGRFASLLKTIVGLVPVLLKSRA